MLIPLVKHKNVYFPYDFSTLKQLSSSVQLVSQGTQKFVNLGQWNHYWWPSNVKSHGISSHSIDLALLEYSVFSTTRLENKYYEVKFYCKGTWPVIHIILLDKLPAINWLFMCVNAQKENIYGLMQDCSISIANAMEILQSCTKPSIWKLNLPILCVKVMNDDIEFLCTKNQQCEYDPDGSSSLWRHQVWIYTCAESAQWPLYLAPKHQLALLTYITGEKVDFPNDSHLLTHWGGETYLYASPTLPIIGSDNGLSPGRHQAIIWTNAGILLIGPLGTNFSEILIKIYTFWFKRMNLKMSSGKWWPSCLCLNGLTPWPLRKYSYSPQWFWNQIS